MAKPKPRLEPVRERVERKQRVTRSSGCHTVRDSDALDRLRPTAVCPAGRALRHRPDGRRVRAARAAPPRAEPARPAARGGPARGARRHPLPAADRVSVAPPAPSLRSIGIRFALLRFETTPQNSFHVGMQVYMWAHDRRIISYCKAKQFSPCAHAPQTRAWAH